MQIPLKGFMPDVDQTTPGAILDCQHFIPTMRGMRSAPTPINAPQGALASECIGMYLARKIDASVRTFAGTVSGLYEASAATWSDVSRVGGYTGGIDSRWRFSQYGNITLAANKVNELQQSTSGAFANVTGAPKAAIVETAERFIFLADTNEGTFGDQPNRYWLSPNLADWTPNIDNEIITGTLVDTPGGITAVRRLGKNLVIYKQNAMYLSSYTGGRFVWEFQTLPGNIGAPSQESVVNIETAHIFVGPDDFYIFDGAGRAQALNAPLREWFFKRLNAKYAYKIIGTHERNNSLVRFYYPSQSGNALDSCVVFNYRTGTWGVDDISVEFAGDYATPLITYDTLGSFYSTYDQLPQIPFDSPFWSATTVSPAVFSAPTHQLALLSGQAAGSYFVPSDIGTDEAHTFIRRVRNRYSKAPTSASLQTYYRDALGIPLVTDYTVPEFQGKFDFMRTARWHRFKCSLVGDAEVLAVNIDAETQGLEGE